MKIHFHERQCVKLINSPNPVEVLYEIVNFFVSVEDGKVSVIVELITIRDFPLPDGGRIASGMTREENILNVTPAKRD